MIKFMSTTPDGRRILGIVLSDRNIERLINKEPMHFNAEQMNLPYIKCNEIIILNYPTEKAFREELERKGMISEKTIITEDKSPEH